MVKKFNEFNRMPNLLIEDKANEVFLKYAEVYPRRLHQVPVDVSDLLDTLWSFVLDIEDLQKIYGEGTLGALYIFDGERRIVIDQSLDPQVNPHMLGRYNFSIAHEAGHWVLHAEDLLARESGEGLFPVKSDPTVLCRSSQKNEIERQADRFASYLLMPHDLVLEVWHNTYGSDAKPQNVYEELKQLRENFGYPPDYRRVSCQTAKDFAKIFAVSSEAMQIRLEELKLIKLEEDLQPDLL